MILTSKVQTFVLWEKKGFDVKNPNCDLILIKP